MGVGHLARRVTELSQSYPAVGWAYLRRASDVRHLPTNVWIEPTNVCNLDCVMCPSGRIPASQRGFVDVELVRRVMCELEPVRPTVYLHVGGEPLLHPRIDELVRIVREHGGSANLYTNATTLDREMADRLLDAGLDWIGFSFDGYDAPTYESIRRDRGGNEGQPGARFERVLGNIRGFLERKRERGLRAPFTHLSLVRLPEILSLAAPGARDVLMRDLKALGLQRFDEVDAHNWAGTLPVTLPERGRRFAVCPSPWTSLVVLWDGAVVPCCLDMMRGHVVGDATKQSLREIMTGSAMTELRAKLGAGKHGEIPICSRCDVPRGGSFLGVSTKVFDELGEILRTFAG